jgi:hypothetical protein
LLDGFGDKVHNVITTAPLLNKGMLLDDVGESLEGTLRRTKQLLVRAWRVPIFALDLQPNRHLKSS